MTMRVPHPSQFCLGGIFTCSFRRPAGPEPCSVLMRSYDDLYILVERNQETQKAFHGELTELAAQHLRDIRLPDAEQRGGLGVL